MSIPEPPPRYPTAAAIDSLARRFGLPNGPNMQDWPWEVADAEPEDQWLVAPFLRRLVEKHRGRYENVESRP